MVAAVRETAWVRPAMARVEVLGVIRPDPAMVALAVPETPAEVQAIAAMEADTAVAAVQEELAVPLVTETATLAVLRVVTAADLAATARVMEDTASTAEAMVVTVAARAMAVVGGMDDKRPFTTR